MFKSLFKNTKMKKIPKIQNLNFFFQLNRVRHPYTGKSKDEIFSHLLVLLEIIHTSGIPLLSSYSLLKMNLSNRKSR